MKKRARSQRLVSEINITPFTDVILVLLIIFMVSTPLIFRSSLKVNLPEAAVNDQPPRNINITVNANGEASIDNNHYNLRYDLKLLQFKLSSLIKNAAEDSITINGDKDVRYDFVIKVVDIAAQLGLTKIVLATEFKRPSP